jgi:cytoskeletal protein CcmA (bactofilin family)
MSDERRRVSDRTSSSPTFVGAGSKLTGNLECEGDLVVGGAVRGDSIVRGLFTLSEGGRWEGTIQATNAVVAGEIEGAVSANEKLEVRKSARIRGTVSARTIAISKGAVIDGEVSVVSGTPVVHYDEKRKG